MIQVIVFAGTTEGRLLCEFLCENGIKTLMCVATDYATQLKSSQANLEINAQRLSEPEMQKLIEESGCKLVVDATHPYASEVRANIKVAAQKADVEYLRLIRGSSNPKLSDEISVADAQQAVEYLQGNNLRALLTIGSKELDKFTSLANFNSRIFPRVLPFAEVVESCTEMGFKGSQLVCMQGPFTHQFNVALIKMLRIDCLVTKDSGDAGGFPQKISAVKETGIKLVVIGRPEEEQGLSLSGAKAFILEKFPQQNKIYPRFPVFIDLKDQKVMVVGGGKIAERRAEILLNFGAKITVVAPETTDRLSSLAEERQLEIKRKKYEKSDLASQKLILAATNDREVNRQVGIDAKEQGVLVSVADKKEESSFYFPGIVSENNLVAGIVSVNADHSKVKEATAKLRGFWEEDIQ